MRCTHPPSQARAGLGSLTAEEMARFTRLNETYQAKFGFPFILAVRNATKATVLGAFSGRVHNGVSQVVGGTRTSLHATITSRSPPPPFPPPSPSLFPPWMEVLFLPHGVLCRT